METEVLRLLLLLLTGQLLLLFPVAASNYECDWCPRHATASLFPNPNPNPNKKEDMMEQLLLPSNGDGVPFHPATASFQFQYGGCYQLRCRDRRVLCSNDDGINVVVVTTNETGGGFLLTRDSFVAMGISSSDQLAGNNLLQVDFRRIPCEYKTKNLAVRVEEESSRKPPAGHLAMRFLYQGGVTDIAAVEIAQEAREAWRPMMAARRRRGSNNKQKQGVWWHTTARAPAGGPLQLRLVITAGSGGKWLRTALPADWQPGGVYDTGIQITDVAVRACTRSCLLIAGNDNDGDVHELRRR
ncbi:hypothetical protein QOZ80_6AG0551240 [Eleusine coracana subsp. coracana]|nr:hypothetical protein QOZ80_6AG0551240 [Eleusine coracana subsp. coracana]